uniref:5-oxoprolinase (ATP-hydrolyzing). 5-OPase. 5-oxo-L-prolinase. Pyroglutamase (ATP-hydrolyzing) n=1 Tax=Magnetococcus massalia (strain MO-1) TaxID=451514 RepID=A0A1S7LH47_MAGMO|nr:5-oxoprolinase (ATP-hydrolyzing). 5-OPase. 5-oxo-L-prolinase. Pyroglutamase (ATP-hydrolyzing) [Candidatus Magnetococcus massalia]
MARLSTDERWRFGIDRGGTFTDIVGIDPNGQTHSCKLLSESPHYPDAAMAGIRQLLQLSPAQPLPIERIGWIRLGTTVATNALLERQGAQVGLLITAGFRDLLAIGDQQRSDLFALAIKQPEQLYQSVEELDARMDAQGESLKEPDPQEIRQALKRLKQTGGEAVAVVLMHAWRNPAHELAVAAVASELGFSQITLSHQALSLIKMTPRGQTALVDAYLSPVLLAYARQVQCHTGDVPLHFMSSSGSLLPPDDFSGKDAILSGPAGGVLGVAAVAKAQHEAQVIGFDMGGTSTDVCRYGGDYERVLEVETAGIRYQTPMLHVETVAAGGGSLLRFDGRQLKVGPASAGAQPGPASYGRGGPAAITDANVVLGRIRPERFPRLFGPAGDASLNVSAAQDALQRLVDEIVTAQPQQLTVEALALGCLDVAVETMCQPIRALAVAQGLDLREHALVAFGGAGGQHACRIAQTLGMPRIYLHPQAGLLSAVGIAHAPLSRQQIKTVLLPLSAAALAQASLEAERMGERLQAQLLTSFVVSLDALEPERVQLGDFRIVGSDTTLTLPLTQQLALLRQQFAQQHRQRFGFAPAEDAQLELVNLHVVVTLREQQVSTGEVVNAVVEAAEPSGWGMVWFSSEQATRTPIYERDQLSADQLLHGPALVMEPHSVIVVEPGFQCQRLADGTVSLAQVAASPASVSEQPAKAVDKSPVMLALFNHRFAHIATRMGETLVRTAHSVNIKERRDFSCAIFDGDGRLVANAPHVPVHLGAMGASVQGLIKDASVTMQPGDVYATNDPRMGGSHLPDITVISPLFIGPQREPTLYVASRGHHADVGGVVPGSMPPFAKSLAEEGIVLANLRLARAGVLDHEAIGAAFAAGEHPARNLPERLADLTAQMAANQSGLDGLLELCESFGHTTVLQFMDAMRENARYAVEQVLRGLLDGQAERHFSFADAMDDGTQLQVKITLKRSADEASDQVHAAVDFSGSAPCHPGNLNAPVAVTKAALLYVLRLLVEEDIPLNDGCLEPVSLYLPEGSLLNPAGRPVAVSGGNVETSQRVVDLLLGAFGVAAASQGTMNNLLFGPLDGGGQSMQGGQYYETIAGGSGATQGHHGASGVQVHMTNTRITDPEVLELRFPYVRLLSFRLRQGSGGAGEWRGGDGVVRAFEFLQPVMLSLVSERRTRAPFGQGGAAAGKPGKQWLVHADGRQEAVAGRLQQKLEAGTQFWLETPGGGGFNSG